MDGKRIREITSEGLIYLDDTDEEQYIEFSMCHQNWVASQTTPDALSNVKEWNRMTDADLLKYIQRLDEWKVVANRNFDGWPYSSQPFIEFHTKPRVRFEFTTQNESGLVRHLIENFGWLTFDIA